VNTERRLIAQPTLWSATLDPADHAALDPGVPDLDRHPDVLVIGGDVIGLATALFCRRAGLRLIQIIQSQRLAAAALGDAGTSAGGGLGPRRHANGLTQLAEGTIPSLEGKGRKMAAAESVKWDHCGEEGCIGIGLATGGKCWAHADDQDVEIAMDRLAENGRLDVRGVTITAELLARLLAAMPRDPERPGWPLLKEPRFERATLGDGARFANATFDGKAWFNGATFGNEANFGGVVFRDEASFVDSTFGDNANFGGAFFAGSAWFSHARFGHRAGFDGVESGGSVYFDEVTMGDWARFGPVIAAEETSLQRATFGRSPDLAISTDRLKCQQAKFPDGARLRIRWAEVTLDNAYFGRPSVLEGAQTFGEVSDAHLMEVVQGKRRTYRTEQPRLICLAGCDVQNLLLVDCDLRACRFAGAHNLAALRLEGAMVLPVTPRGWQVGWALPPLWWWGRRQTVAEEHYWRQDQRKKRGWRGATLSSPSPHATDWHGIGERGDPSNPYGPKEIASVYRALRKGREDNKDEPGAADFYYGEMEMRRHDPTKLRVERLVLFLYWVVSGYALRASRALAWLLGVLVLATVLLAVMGLAQPVTTPSMEATITGTPPHQTVRFQPPSVSPADRSLPARLATAALVAVEGAVFRTSEQELTYRGRLIQAVLRFVGPILLGLAVLSIRGRVKR
jgi:Pentapeptide repeats (9 copies)